MIPSFELPVFCVWTDNYRRLYDRWWQSLPAGLTPVDLKLPAVPKIETGFLSPHMRLCVRLKQHLLHAYLSTLPDGRLVAVSDCDIRFIKTDETAWWTITQYFLGDPELEFLFAREREIEHVNAGFYVLRNSAKVRDFIAGADIACREAWPQLEQTYFNHHLATLRYERLPLGCTIWGTEIYDASQALFHHAVRAGDEDGKLAQQDAVWEKLGAAGCLT